MRRLLFPHLALWVLGAALVRVALIPAETCPPVTAGQARAAIAEAAAWLERGLDGDGRYVYGYTRDTDVESPAYNLVRHAGAVYSLYRVASQGEGDTVGAADAGLAFMLDRLEPAGGGTAFAEPGQRVELGANGLFLVALAERRAATGDPAYDGVMRDVAAFIVGQREPDGALLALWDPRTGLPVPGTYGIFATGEAFWGLVRLHQIFPDEGWDDAARPTARYLATERDRREGQVTMYPDHWAAYGMADLAAAGERLDGDLVHYARRLAGFFSVRTRVESQRTGHGVNLLVRGWPGPPSGVGTAGEGAAALWRLAGDDPRLAELRPGLEEDLRCMAGMSVARQVSAAEASGYPRPGLVRGAWFYRDYTQVDDQQHTIAALVDTLPILDPTR